MEALQDERAGGVPTPTRGEDGRGENGLLEDANSSSAASADKKKEDGKGG